MSPRQEQRAAASWAEAQRASEQMAHARQAAREITHERTESARVVGGVAGAAHEEGQPQPQHVEVEVHRGGILETVQQGARSLVSAVSRTLGVASRDATAECPLAESKDHAARAAEGTEESAARGREGQEWRGHGGEVP